MRSIFAALGFAAALLCAAPASAHGELEVAGTVTAISATTLEIRTAAGKVVRISLDAQTRYASAGKRLTAADVKVGQRVDVIGVGDSFEDIAAMDVTVEAPPGRAR